MAGTKTQLGSPTARGLLLTFLLAACTLTGPESRPTLPSEGTLTFDPAKFPHPKGGTAWDTRAHLAISTRAVDPKALEVCLKGLAELAEEARTEKEILELQASFLGLVRKDPELHHWCFYEAMTALDEALSKPGASFEAKSDRFLDTMKVLWILATALDRHLNLKTYFVYLRTRYLEISRETFGRGLSIIGKPLDLLPRPAFEPQKPQGLTKDGPD